MASLGTACWPRLRRWARFGMPTGTRLWLPARISRQAPARLWCRALVRARLRRGLSLGDGLRDNSLHAVRVIGQASQQDVAERCMHQFREAGIGFGLGLSVDVRLGLGAL